MNHYSVSVNTKRKKKTHQKLHKSYCHSQIPTGPQLLANFRYYHFLQNMNKIISKAKLVKRYETTSLCQ